MNIAPFAAGFGVGLVTESCIGANFSGLTYRELRDGVGPSRVGFSAHWRSDNDNNAALATFLKLLGSAIRCRPIDLE
jgi:DNA-binding transcriptional LysR family regulator